METYQLSYSLNPINMTKLGNFGHSDQGEQQKERARFFHYRHFWDENGNYHPFLYIFLVFSQIVFWSIVQKYKSSTLIK